MIRMKNQQSLGCLMRKLTHIFNVVCMSVILLCSSSVLCMENYEQKASIAEEYNQNDPRLCDDILGQIFPCCLAYDDMSVVALAKSEDHVKLLENSIKNFMKLRSVCKKFNKLLTFEVIGNFCVQGDKNKVLQKLISPEITDSKYYAVKRLVALILVCAGADPHVRGKYSAYCCSSSLFESAVMYDDVQLVTMAFKHGADAHIKDVNGFPLFFSARTVDMAQVFIAKGVDVHIEGVYTNVLFKAISASHASELLEFYLKGNVNPRTKFFLTGNCLLHELASPYTRQDDNFFRKVQLLLDVIPDMINTLNNEEKTPMDVAQESLEEAKKSPNKEYADEKTEGFNRLIPLFKKYGGKTTDELAKYNTK